MNKPAFGKFSSEGPQNLREFERYLKIPAREGPDAWTSEYPSVQKLLTHLGRCSHSESSRRKYLNTLKLFSQVVGFQPEQLVSFSVQEATRVVQGYVDELFRKDRSRSYINTVIHKIRTFFRVNNMELDVETYHQPSRYRRRPEYVPRKEEVYAMADATNSIRNRALILCLWSSGLRVSTLAALDYSDVVDELEEGKSTVKIDVYPKMKERNHNACKGDIRYYTFIFPGAVRALKTYLKERKEKWGYIGRNEPLFQSKWTYWKKGERRDKRISSKTIRKVVKDAAELAELDDWKYVSPQCLRKAFQSVLRSPTVHGGRLDKSTQEFLMGHILPGSRDPYYDVDDVEFHRREYSKLDFSREGSGSAQTRDKMVNVSELQVHLDEGWIFVEKISENDVVIRRKFEVR